MTLTRALSPVAAAIVLAGFVGVASAMDMPQSPADAAFLDAMNGMMADMHRHKPTGNTDVDFAQMMIPHHQAAVDMARTELKLGTDPDLRALAQDIVASQDREIAMMRSWLAKHAGKP